MRKTSLALIGGLSILFSLASCNEQTPGSSASQISSFEESSLPSSEVPSSASQGDVSFSSSEESSLPSSEMSSSEIESSEVSSYAEQSESSSEDVPSSIAPDPEEPYQAPFDYWKANITDGGFLTRDFNLTLLLSGLDGEGNALTGFLKNDEGKFHLQASYQGTTTEFYVGLLPNGLTLYSLGEEGWEVEALPPRRTAPIIASYSQFLLPFEYASFEYNSATHAYECPSLVAENGRNATNIAIRFADGELLSLTYSGSFSFEGDLAFEGDIGISMASQGATSVTFPTAEERLAVYPEVPVLVSETAMDFEIGDEPRALKAYGKSYGWYENARFVSADPRIADVSEGMVRPVSVGKTYIFCTDFDGNQCTACIVTVRERSGSGPQEGNPFHGIALRFRHPSYGDRAAHPYYSYSDTYGIDWLYERMGHISISFFPDGEIVGNDVVGASFEFSSFDEAGGIDYAYFGTYSTNMAEGRASIDLSSFYSKKAGTYFHGNHISQRLAKENAFELTQDFEFYEKGSVDDYVVEGIFHDPDCYAGTYPYSGCFTFTKAEASPKHLEGLPEDLHDDNYESFVENQYFESASKVSVSESGMTTTSQQSIHIFEGNYLELRHASHRVLGEESFFDEVVYCGSYEIAPAEEGDSLYAPNSLAIIFRASCRYNGIDVGSNSDIFHFLYDKETHGITSNDWTGPFEWKEGIAPTRYEPVVPDRWEAALIAERLSALGATDPLPSPVGVESCSVGPIDEAGSSFAIEVVLANMERNGKMGRYQYSEILRAEGFVSFAPYSYSVSHYYSPRGQFFLTITKGNTALGLDKLTLEVSKRVLEYPSAAFAEYMEAQGFDDPIIDFVAEEAVDYLSYSDGSLRIAFPYRTSLEDLNAVVSRFVSELKAIGYGSKLYWDSEYCIAPSQKFAIGFRTYADYSDYYIDVFFRSAKFPTEECPQSEIDAYLVGVQDPTLDFSDERIRYYEPSISYWGNLNLTLYLKSGSTYGDYRPVLTQKLEELGYTYYWQVTYTVGKGTEDEVACAINSAYVSPNQEVAYVFESTATMNAYVRVQIYNLASYADVVCSSTW